MKSAYATIKGFEVMRTFKKSQFDVWMPEKNILGEMRLVNKNFGIYNL